MNQKLTEEELSKLNELQKSSNKIITDIAYLTISENNLEQELIKIKNDKAFALKDFETLKEQSEFFGKTLEEKYGSGRIDLGSGEIIPI